MSKTPKRGANGGKRDGRAPGRNGDDFLVVGLGASAGGIRALEQFFGRMPADSGMAFVVALHLSPEHESSLPGILQRHTAMPVEQVNGSIRVEPNRVYVIPPAKHLVMEEGHIHLAEPDQEPGRRVPIDLLFRSLGAAYREHAVGVVLSGTGSDGTLGLRRIKEEGGISVAQEPQEAEYEGMPRSAVRGGMVDFVLPVAAMPEKLLGIRDATQRIRLPPEGSEPPRGEELAALRDILSMLRVRTGHDFSGYKQSTLLRRITRRMQMHEVPTLAAYRQYLREHTSELPELMQDLLISVTNFFRDPASFDFLGREVVPKLFEGKHEDDYVRVWVTGCATGEEAYSLAILLAEHAERLERPPQIQIFATDLDEEAIVQAREGVFPETVAADVPPARLQQFFTHEGRRYAVKKHIRETILFAPHNILRDPPFTRIDLVSCRNLLIYLNRETQARVLQIFHFALRPGGFLFLGSAESADSLPDLFTPVDQKLRVFRRTAVASALNHLPPMSSPGRREPRHAPDAAAAGLKSYSYAELHRTLLEHHAPPSVLVNEAYDVVHLSENAGKYLRVAGGEPSNNLLALLHPGLRLDVRAALFSSAQEAGEVVTRPLPVRLDGETRQVTVRVRQIKRPDLHAAYLLVIFDEAADAPAAAALAVAETDGADARAHAVERLELELQQTRSVLRATVEQYETANKELRASNEELQALNEELRSASEELETGKEELQSLNEELHTVNAELKDKVDELGRTNTDLTTLLAAADIGIVFLDGELNITRYTPLFAELFNVIPADVGRPFAHLTHRLDYQGLPQDAARAITRLQPFEREVRSAEGAWYAARLVPYRASDDRIAGVVVTFMDITTRKLAEERAQYVHEQLVMATDAAEAGRGTWDLRTGAAQWDERGRKIIGFADEAEAATTAGWLARVHPEDRPAVEAHLAECVAQDKDLGVEYRVVRADGETRFVSTKGRFRKAPDGTPLGGTGLVVDVTERRRGDELLRESEGWLRSLFESATDYAIFTMGSDRRITSWSAGAERLFGYAEEEALGQPGDFIFTPEDCERGVPAEEQRQADAEGRAADERWHMRKDGSRFYMSGVLSRLLGGGPSPGYVKIGRDLTRQHRSEQERTELAAQLEAERGSLEERVEERTRLLMTEVAERRTAEERVRELVSRIVETQELERRRISRDLHDILGQQLTALRLNLEAIKESCGEKDADTFGRIEQAQASASRLDSEVDFLAWELRPASLDEVGLVSALENFVHEWSAHFGVPAEYHSGGLGKRRLAPELETNLYRIAQEALNNIAKHGAAHRVGVILERREKHVALIVEDDGRGFGPSGPMDGTDGEAGMGLFNMRERAALVGGTLEIESAPGEGTTVFARVPARFAERR